MMDRKKTILVAVLINVGLLVVLFVAALTTEEEVMPQMALVAEPAPQPLFAEPVDLGVKPPPLLDISQPTDLPPVNLPPLVPESHPPIVASSPSPPPTAPAESPAFIEVVVKKGDSLEKIAKLHQTTVPELIKINHLSNHFLRTGQVLKVPTKKTAATTALKPTVAPSESNAEFYTVKVGDNPWTIAMKHHMKVEELLKLNGLNEERAKKLRPGDRLRIR